MNVGVLQLPLLLVAAATFGIAAAQTAVEPSHDHAQSHNHALSHGIGAAATSRTLVRFPPQLKTHTLASMRDHLAALGEIQYFLSRQEYEKAAEVAERRLGMSSLPAHGAHEVAKYMPEGMRAAGTSMHRSASRFALKAQEAAVDHDLPGTLAQLNLVTQACVACHAAYALK